MSYCRWSSDNFNCDLYCYEDVQGGWTTHVAASRHVGECPSLPDILSTSAEDFVAAHKRQMSFLDAAEYRPIGLSHDGETFNDPTLESFKERLLYLRGVGYKFPDHVLTTIDDELKENRECTDKL